MLQVPMDMLYTWQPQCPRCQFPAQRSWAWLFTPAIYWGGGGVVRIDCIVQRLSIFFKRTCLSIRPWRTEMSEVDNYCRHLGKNDGKQQTFRVFLFHLFLQPCSARLRAGWWNMSRRHHYTVHYRTVMLFCASSRPPPLHCTFCTWRWQNIQTDCFAINSLYRPSWQAAQRQQCYRDVVVLRFDNPGSDNLTPSGKEDRLAVGWFDLCRSNLSMWREDSPGQSFLVADLVTSWSDNTEPDVLAYLYDGSSISSQCDVMSLMSRGPWLVVNGVQKNILGSKLGHRKLRPMSDTQQSWAILSLNFIAQQICL